MHTELGARTSLRLVLKLEVHGNHEGGGSFKHSFSGPTPESLKQVCLGHEHLNFQRAPSWCRTTGPGLLL